ncbi:hypothetical protein CSOJ01_10544 [Colletotrichum sojae]|uniref:Uncharacterized protein n=1 Tax=Colletotrichum sojae TaxID=2175907 RepID=A0A8H6MP46_9PEZI|nr:hypothetical protein CSOJ01_10544 [Colletotrichum sojae]
MSSNETTPYTVPYTGAAGNHVAHQFAPASSMEHTVAAHPPAPQDNQHAAYQKPAVADEPKGPNTGFAMGESTAMAGGGTKATSDANSAARRSSVVQAAPSGPSDVIPTRFASASSGSGGSGGIAIIHEGDRQSADIHSTVAQSEHGNNTQGASTFGLDGHDDHQGHSVNPVINNPSPQVTNTNNLGQVDSDQLSGTKENAYRNVSLNMWDTSDAEADTVAALGIQNQLQMQNEVLEVQNELLQDEVENLTDLVVNLNNRIHASNPALLAQLPDNMKVMMEGIYEHWKTNQWSQLLDDYQEEIIYSATEEDVFGGNNQVAGLGIHYN